MFISSTQNLQRGLEFERSNGRRGLRSKVVAHRAKIQSEMAERLAKANKGEKV